MHSSPKAAARVPPATPELRATKAKAQIGKWNNAKRLFADLEETASSKDAIIEATIKRVRQTDPVGDVLPCGRSMMFVPTASEEQKMYDSALSALADEGMDDYDKGKKAYRTRPGARNISTIEAKLHKHRKDVAKAKAKKLAEAEAEEEESA